MCQKLSLLSQKGQKLMTYDQIKDHRLAGGLFIIRPPADRFNVSIYREGICHIKVTIPKEIPGLNYSKLPIAQFNINRVGSHLGIPISRRLFICIPTQMADLNKFECPYCFSTKVIGTFIIRCKECETNLSKETGKPRKLLYDKVIEVINHNIGDYIYNDI